MTPPLPSLNVKPLYPGNRPTALACLSALFLLASSLAAEPESSAPPTAPYAWWRPGTARRLEGGWVAQPLSLRVAEASVAAGDVEVTLRTRRMGPPAEGDNAPAESWWRLEAFPEAPFSGNVFAVEAIGGAGFRVTAWARVRLGGLDHWAITDFLLYGDAPEPVLRGAAGTEPFLDPPAFTWKSDGAAYWPQTGEWFRLRPAVEFADQLDTLSVFDESGQLLASPARGEDGHFAYRPEHDPALDQAGDAASKPLVFVARAPDDRHSVSFALSVHRSRRASLRLGPGLSILTGAFLASVLFACWRRGKWWKKS